MGEYERVPIEDWEAVTDHLRTLATERGVGEDEIDESQQGIEMTVGSATFLVTKDGRVSAGMPLHDFEDGEIEALYVDHERGVIRVEDGDRSYEFRVPS